MTTATAAASCSTDEFGPTHDNLIAHNVIKDNVSDCGVTVPGHNPMALDSNGHRQPSVAGDYRNVIADNVITGNGVMGEGAGVIFANASAGSASYDNLVRLAYTTQGCRSFLRHSTVRATSRGGPTRRC